MEPQLRGCQDALREALAELVEARKENAVLTLACDLTNPVQARLEKDREEAIQQRDALAAMLRRVVAKYDHWDQAEDEEWEAEAVGPMVAAFREAHAMLATIEATPQRND